MKKILFHFISLLPFSGLLAQYPCPEIISSEISPNSGNFCPGDELTLSWDGINLENAIDCGFGWTFWNAEQPGSINYIQEIPYQINFGACVAPEMLYVMVNPDDTLVGGPDDCHDEFVVLYIGGPRPRDCGGGPIGLFINQIQLCFTYQLIGNYCSGSGWWHNYVPGNTSVFNCGTPLGPNDYIPENSILIIQTSPHGEVNYDLGEICNMGIPVYVIAIDTPEECTGGFIPNSTDECSSCALLYWPGWCLPGGENDYGTVGLDYDLPTMPVSGWGISNSLGGDEFGSVVPDVDVTEFYTGTEVIPLPVTWQIPGDFCLNYGPGTYQIAGGLDSWLYTICPESQITTDVFEVTISCPEVSAGEDITICEGGIVPVEGDVFGSAGSYEWTTNGDGEFGDPSLVETTYSPGPNDISNGQVILSLMFLSCETVSDDLILTIIDMIQVDAGSDQTICSDEDVDLDAIISGGGNPMVIWTTDGDGLFSNSGEPETNYTPGPDDIDNGVVHLTLTAIDPFGMCTPVSITIQITILNAITITGVPDQVCHYDDPISLPTTQSSYTGNWSGTGVTNNTFNPNGLDGVYALIFVPDQMVCGANATTWITVIAQTPSLNLPAFFCESGSPYDLNSVAYWETMMNIIPGVWSGTGVTNNTFDPSGLSGFVWLTFEPDPIYCLTTVTGQIEVVEEFTPQIIGIPASVCEDDNPISLPTNQDGVDGQWSGPGVTNNVFDPAGLNGIITILFTPDPQQCALPAETFITVITCSNPPCPSAGQDTTITFYPSPDQAISLEVLLNFIGADTGGTWDPPFIIGTGYYPCVDGEGPFTYTQDNPGCPIEITTVTFNWLWNPCDWEIGEVCWTEEGLSITVPPFPGPHPDVPYIIDESCGSLPYDEFDLDSLNTLLNMDYCADSCTYIQIHLDLSPVAPSWEGNGYFILFVDYTCDFPSCTCADPPYAGEDNSIDICIDADPFDLTTSLGGNPDGGGYWTPQLNSGGNIYDPILDGTGIFTHTVIGTSGCPNDAASVLVTVLDSINPMLSGVPTSLCENDIPFLLPDNQDGITGNWAGQGVSNNTFDPSGLNGNVMLTFIPYQGQCAGEVTTDIYVDTFVPLTISSVPDSLCELNSPVTLLNIQTGVQGNWSGLGVSNNVFNPSGLSGDIVLTFTPDTTQCAEAVTTDITVENATIPLISGIPDSLCQWDAAVALPDLQNGIAGDWSGPGVMNNTFDPAGQSGLVILIFTPDAGQCASVVSHGITVSVPTAPDISGVPAILCENESPVSLPTGQSGNGGTWSGEGVSSNIFDPSSLSGLITLAFTHDASQCALGTSVEISVIDMIVPIITGVPESVCQVDSPIFLSTVHDNISGTWSGQGVTNNTFNPSGLTGVIELLFTPDTGQCTDAVEIEIIVDEAILPLISDIPEALCQLNEAIILPSQIDGISGAWSGQGVMNNTFNPLDLDGQITLTYIPDTGQCALATSITIDVSATVIPEISGLPATLCQSEPVIQLPVMQAGMTGYWTGPGVLNNTLDPSGPEGAILLVFHPLSNACAENAMVEIVINSTPAFVNLNASCDSISQSYTVSFDIYGGDPLSYTVNGAPVGGSSFVSAPIDADNIYYSFILNDANACGPVAVSGSLNCACATFAGTMSLSNQPVKICEGSGFTVMHLGNDNLDPDDILEYVLHDQAGTQLGTILATSQAPTFSYPPGVTLGQVYYVSAIAGTNSGNGNIDLSDECLSVSQGVPVLFYKPEFALSAGTEICANECVTYSILLTGVQPFVFSYQVLANDTSFNQSVMSDTGSATITLCPAAFGITSGTLDIQPLTLSDANCIITLPPQQTVVTTILGHSLASISHGICPGESILVNGITYDQNNLKGTQTLEGANAFGCDSVIEINLWALEPAVFDITRTLCEGASLVINGNEYNSDRPTGIEVIPGGSVNGCDSTITISLTFDSILVENIIAILCADESLVVKETIYDITNPSGTEVIPGGSTSGCDSVINIELSFYPLAVINLDKTLCPGDSLIVNGTVYDDDNVSGTEFIPGGSIHGCDSIVEVNITFYPEAIVSITDTLFSGDSIVVQGVLFDVSNPGGTVVMPGGSVSGCDSIVAVQLHFLSQLSAVIEVVDPVCPEEAGVIILEALFGGNFPFTVVLDGMDTMIVSALPYILQNLAGGIHDIWIRDAFAFTFHTQIELQEPSSLSVDAGADQFIAEGTNTFLHGTANFEVGSWQWSPPDFLSCTTCADPVVIHPDQPITYTLNVTDLYGCITSDVVTVFVEEEAKVFMPNAFTPNGDGTNDTWTFYSEDVDARIQNLVVYDRWGGIMFSRSDIAVNDPAAGWDGMVNGSQIHPGVYIFRADLVTSNGKVTHLHGDVTLFR